MSGLEKIISRIMEQANAQAEEITAEARKEADDILAAASKEVEQMKEDAAVKSRRAIENYRSRAESAADMQKRTAVLRAKQEMIQDMLEKAYNAICKEDDEAYFNRIETMIGQYAQPGNGEIVFSSKDRNRLPQDFTARIGAAAAKAGGTLTVRENGADIENGFILVYGGIEENCTIRAMFDTKKDELTDIIQKILYG
ncbi:MAG: hypothetical protein HFG80_12715 [Eubacterium sp.]|nr:hypothetical protein [Eubacterium sp.]